MTKKLTEMTKEELWQRFPIVLTCHQAHWAKWYREEEASLLAAFSGMPVVRISHIGSTAVKTIWAKPIVDILVETTPDCDWADLDKRLTCGGYLCMSRSEGRISYNKGYTVNGFAQRVLSHRKSGGRPAVRTPDVAFMEAVRARPRRLYRRED